MTARAETFYYRGLEVGAHELVGHYQLDDHRFRERVDFDPSLRLDTPAVKAVAQLWYLISGLSYFKAGAARRIDLGATPVGSAGRALFEAALRDGLGEFSFRNNLPLDDVEIVGGVDSSAYSPSLDPRRVLVPFGGGVDSVVTITQLNVELDRALFVVSPASGRFDSLEATAAVTGLVIVRATRSLDSQILAGDTSFLRGHVPVTTMVTLLGAVAAIATGRGAVVMSNEHSSSVPNIRWRGVDVNHQWSKSWAAEVLVGESLAELVGSNFTVASYLRNRSELWVAQVFSRYPEYHHVFRSCNRAFTQETARRAVQWCGECDKCLFINLILAPFLERAVLSEIFGSEPLSDPTLEAQLRTLVGLGVDHKPFECVGDPDESAAALTRVATLPAWRDVHHLREVARMVSPAVSFVDLLKPRGPSRVPAHWLR